MKQRWGVILVVACISFFSGGWLLQRGVDNDGGVYRSARLFDDVLARVQTYYVDSIGEAALYQKATVGMLDELHDPYTDLLQGDNYKALTETTTGNYGGLGIQIDVRGGWITVVAPLPDTPAERAGIQTGDQIVGHQRHDDRGLLLGEGGLDAARTGGQRRGPDGATAPGCIGADPIQADARADPQPVGRFPDALPERRRVYRAHHGQPGLHE